MPFKDRFITALIMHRLHDISVNIFIGDRNNNKFQTNYNINNVMANTWLNSKYNYVPGHEV